jgi:hypothetical protein
MKDIKIELGWFWGFVIVQALFLIANFWFDLHLPWFVLLIPILVWLACLVALLILIGIFLMAWIVVYARMLNDGWV